MVHIELTQRQKYASCCMLECAKDVEAFYTVLANERNHRRREGRRKGVKSKRVRKEWRAKELDFCFVCKIEYDIDILRMIRAELQRNRMLRTRLKLKRVVDRRNETRSEERHTYEKHATDAMRMHKRNKDDSIIIKLHRIRMRRNKTDGENIMQMASVRWK